MNTMEYPIITILGIRGGGKTVTATALAKIYEQMGLNVFANYTLKDTKYTHVTFSDLANFPKWLENGIVIIDETHVGADAYKFFAKQVQDITLFATQTRKRKLVVILITQVFTQMTKRLRDLTDYIIECERANEKGWHILTVYDKRTAYEPLTMHYLDARPFYKYYDTGEIIQDT